MINIVPPSAAEVVGVPTESVLSLATFSSEGVRCALRVLTICWISALQPSTFPLLWSVCGESALILRARSTSHVRLELLDTVSARIDRLLPLT